MPDTVSRSCPAFWRIGFLLVVAHTGVLVLLAILTVILWKPGRDSLHPSVETVDWSYVQLHVGIAYMTVSYSNWIGLVVVASNVLALLAFASARRGKLDRRLAVTYAAIAFPLVTIVVTSAWWLEGAGRVKLSPHSDAEFGDLGGFIPVALFVSAPLWLLLGRALYVAVERLCSGRQASTGL